MFRKISVTQKIVLGFMSVILVGSLLLSLPISQIATSKANYIDHLFTTVSMVCVTGLSTVPVSETYSIFGQSVGMILMQIGGLGWMTVLSLLMVYLGDKLSLSRQQVLFDALNLKTGAGMKKFLRRVFLFSLAVEFVFAGILMTDFIGRFGFFQGIFNSLFLAVSAFCNAGFDNLGANSLQSFAGNPIINFAVAVPIVFGGLGFSVWSELIDRFKNRKNIRRKLLSPHARIVLTMTGILLLAGTLIPWLLEKHNPQTLGNRPILEQFMVSGFQSVTMRTAGFATLDYNMTSPVTNFIYVILMLVGGAPGGTAGGLKVTTVFILFLLLRSMMWGEDATTYRWRKLPARSVSQVLIIIALFMGTLVVGYGLLLHFNPHISSDKLWFEAVSAIATVGVTMGITAELSLIGKIIIMSLMFIGRVGAVTILLSMAHKHKKKVKYPETNILVG